MEESNDDPAMEGEGFDLKEEVEVESHCID